jgi:hypothetical protein
MKIQIYLSKIINGIKQFRDAVINNQEGLSLKSKYMAGEAWRNFCKHLENYLGLIGW